MQLHQSQMPLSHSCKHLHTSMNPITPFLVSITHQYNPLSLPRTHQHTQCTTSLYPTLTSTLPSLLIPITHQYTPPSLSVLDIPAAAIPASAHDHTQKYLGHVPRYMACGGRWAEHDR